MRPPPVIAVRNVSKKFRLFASPRERLLEALHPFRKQYHHEFWALRDISFEVERGEVLGILGRNGSGKSTLLQIICGVMQATSGEVHVNGRIAALLELGAGFNPEFTGRDNIILNGAILGFSRKEMLRRLPEIEAFADIGEFFDQPVKTYSSGMFARVAFSSAIHVNPDVLIVDEILGVGDAKFQEKCYNRIRSMREKGVCILFVSHSTEAIQRNCNTALLLDSGKIVARDSVDAVIAAYHDLLYGSGHAGKIETNALAPEQKHAVLIDHHNQASDIEFQRFLDGSNGPVCEKFPYYNSHERRFGNGDAKIVDLIVAADGKFDFGFLSGSESLMIYVKVRFARTVDAPQIGWAIVSPEGIMISGSNSLSRNRMLPAAKIGETWIYAISMETGLCGGEFFINVGVSSFDGESWTFLDNRRSVIHLSVTRSERSSGFVDLPSSCSVYRAPIATLH